MPREGSCLCRSPLGCGEPHRPPPRRQDGGEAGDTEAPGGERRSSMAGRWGVDSDGVDAGDCPVWCGVDSGHSLVPMTMVWTQGRRGADMGDGTVWMQGMVWCGHRRLSSADAGTVRGGHGGQSCANEDGVDTGDSVVWTWGL